MKIHEYQAKEILATFGVRVPRGRLALSADAAVDAATALGGHVWVVKAQIHAGGRGKGGGIRVCKSLDEVRSNAAAMLGQALVTPQTGPRGRVVRQVYIEEGLSIARELYLSVVLDRERRRLVLMASQDGGMDIEEVAATHPDRIIKEAFDTVAGLQPFHLRHLCKGLDLSGATAKKVAELASGLCRAFIERDASLIEINPLILTADGDAVALDAKMTFDDNALFRHPEVAALRDLDEEDPLEVRASRHDLNYIKLDGDIGNMVNGAGLAMATMDIIQHFGGRPANFLDVGGSADRAKVKAAFEIILSDDVRAVLVNIFGGIMRCDVIADGIVAAAREVAIQVPLVVRLQGTNVDIGRRILAESGLPVITAESMADAAQAVVEAARQGGG